MAFGSRCSKKICFNYKTDTLHLVDEVTLGNFAYWGILHGEDVKAENVVRRIFTLAATNDPVDNGKHCNKCHLIHYLQSLYFYFTDRYLPFVRLKEVPTNIKKEGDLMADVIPFSLNMLIFTRPPALSSSISFAA